MKAAEVVRRERLRDPSRRPLLVVVTDGRATAGPDAVGRAQQAAAYLVNESIGSIVVDCESGRMRWVWPRTWLSISTPSMSRLRTSTLRRWPTSSAARRLRERPDAAGSGIGRAR